MLLHCDNAGRHCILHDSWLAEAKGWCLKDSITIMLMTMHNPDMGYIIIRHHHCRNLGIPNRGKLTVENRSARWCRFPVSERWRQHRSQRGWRQHHPCSRLSSGQLSKLLHSTPGHRCKWSRRQHCHCQHWKCRGSSSSASQW